MSLSQPGRNLLPTSTFRELFTPKLVTVLREGYGAREFRADALAGLTVAIVALPLSMAIAIASGLPPANGLVAAIIAGFLISALGGSRYQIGGPAGAFIVLIATTVDRHGVDGMLLATAMAGVFLIVGGLLKLGTYVKLVPYPVTVGFTTGIAVIIMASQIKDLLGLKLPGKEPGPLLEKLPVLWQSLPTASMATIAVAGGTIAFILGLRKWRPHWPGLLIAVIVAAVTVKVLGLDVETISSRFGGISGAFFFGAAATLGAALDRIADDHKAFIVDFSAVPLLDSTAARTMHGTIAKAVRRGAKVYLTGTNAAVRRELFVHNVRPPHVKYMARMEDAIESWTEIGRRGADAETEVL